MTEMLSKDLSVLHGKGFSLSNLIRMRQFFVAYSIYATVSHQLGWAHYSRSVYSMHNVSSQLFVSKYQLYLPDRDELKAVIEERLNDVKDQ